MKKFIIIGAGAVGKTYGLQLQQAGQEVHYLVNQEYHSIKNGENRFEFNFLETNSSIRIDAPKIYQTTEELPKDADFNFYGIFLLADFLLYVEFQLQF